MTTIMVMPETYSLAYTKAHFSELIERVQNEQERITVTKNGEPVAVLLHPDELESIEETLDIVSNPEAMAEIRQSEQDFAEGNFVDSDQLRAMFLDK